MDKLARLNYLKKQIYSIQCYLEHWDKYVYPEPNNTHWKIQVKLEKRKRKLLFFTRSHTPYIEKIADIELPIWLVEQMPALLNKHLADLQLEFNQLLNNTADDKENR